MIYIIYEISYAIKPKKKKKKKKKEKLNQIPYQCFDFIKQNFWTIIYRFFS